MFSTVLFVAFFCQLTDADSEFHWCPSTRQMLSCECSQYFQNWLKVICEKSAAEDVFEALSFVAQRKGLVVLKLKEIQLHNLTSSLLGGQHVLLELTMEHCHLSSVDDDAFGDFASHLRKLTLSHNPLVRVPSQALQNLSSVKEMSLEYNLFEVLDAGAFKDLHSLHTLSLRGNRIKSIDISAFVGIGNLIVLDLGENELTDASVATKPLHSMNKLQYLGFEGNTISNLKPEVFDTKLGDSLTSLNLRKNSILELPPRAFLWLKKLQILYLSNNSIESLHPYTFEGVEGTLFYLDLAYNHLNEIPADSLKNLKKLSFLHFDGNNICRIRKDDLLPHTGLSFLYLRNNSLTYIHPDTFVSKPSLVGLYLQSNRLTAAPRETFAPAMGTLEIFEMHDNPFQCDCQISWLSEWIQKEGSKKIACPSTLLDIKCAWPEEFAGTPVSKVPKDQLVCRDSTPKPPQYHCNAISFTSSNSRRLSPGIFALTAQISFAYFAIAFGTRRLT